MDSVLAGETFATGGDSEKLTAPQHGFVDPPNKNATINAEWFFFGVREDF
ncbi:MAG: hypothetical protein H6677_16925 [Candidatus Obscuribacterales bacterium]|nr:hypothetical protein [Cyanobacteria bacterium HKST-UBA01]MCB9469957.1 hypothetical protein [Candidatus Obscuribacterales bacterium]